MSTELERGLLWHLFHEPGYPQRVKASGLTSEDIDEPRLRRAISFAMNHLDAHGAMPGQAEVETLTEQEIRQVHLSAAYILGELVGRKLFRRVRDHVQDVTQSLSQNRPTEAWDKIRQFADDGAGVSSAPPTNLLHAGPAVVDLYQRVRSGYTGTPYPWPTLTEMTKGMWPGTVTVFVARPGVGKTFVATICARHAWQHCEGSPLIISPEMDKLELAERFFVLESGVSYKDIVRGTLSDLALPLFVNRVSELQAPSHKPLWIMDSDDDISPKGIEAAIDHLRPSLVAIDSLYDLRFKGDVTERLIAACGWARRLAKRKRVPVVGFSQLNRSAEAPAKKGGGARQSTVALTDQLSWDVYNLFALEQDDDMRADRRMRVKKLKLRRGFAPNDSIDVHWDFDRMRFTEIEPADRARFRDSNDGFDPVQGFR